MDFKLLNPLIKETTHNALFSLPSNSQTGPAKRNDQKTILNHLKQLKGNPDWQNIYKKISEDIQRMDNSDRRQTHCACSPDTMIYCCSSR